VFSFTNAVLEQEKEVGICLLILENINFYDQNYEIN